MPKAKTHHDLSLTRQKHKERTERPWYPEIEDDPELAAAYQSLQLYWIRNVPGYRERLKEKLSEAAKQANQRAMKIETNQRTVDGQRLGQRLREDQLERLVGY